MNENNTALLVMDMQEMLVNSLPDHEQLIKNHQTIIAHARKLNIPIIYVVVGFRPTLDEISSNNKNFIRIAQQLSDVPMEKWMKIVPSITPLENENIVVKKRFSAFAGSDLDMLLRANSIQHLILTGIVTSGVVLSTAVEAADKDYQLTILSDACQDRDEKVHQFLVEKILTRYAEIKTVNDWINI